MRDIVFKELSKHNKMIESVRDEEEKESGYRLFFKTINMLVEIGETFRNEGLLAIDDIVENIEEDFPNSRSMKNLLIYVSYGYDPELIEEMGLSHYFAKNLEAFEAIQYLLIIYGILAIQSGGEEKYVRDRLLALLPCDAENLYIKERQELLSTPEAQEKEMNDRLSQCYYGSIATKPGEKDYYKLKAASEAICAIDDENMKRVIKDIDRNELIYALRGISGEARQRILSNMPILAAIKVIDNMEHSGPARMTDLVQCSMNIYALIVKLIDSGEISCEGGGRLCTFYKFFTDGGEQWLKD